MKFLFSFLLIIPFYCFSQSASVTGVITYYFNDYQGNKPDLGAKVYLIDTSKASFFDLGSIDTFIQAKLYRRLVISYLNMEADYLGLANTYKGKKRFKEEYEKNITKAAELRATADKYQHHLDSIGVPSDQKFEELSNRVGEIGRKLNEDNAMIRTVDASGHYTMSVKPSVYYIYIISKNREGSNSAEILGKIYSRLVSVKDGDSKDISYNFDLY
jgi:hypothetical protein